MTGALAQDLDAAYRAADLLVAPSRTESYGMAIADALARGIPVIGSNVGGIPLTVFARSRRDPCAAGTAGAEQGARPLDARSRTGG